MKPSFILLAAFLLLSHLAVLALGQSCSTCVFQAGASLGALRFRNGEQRSSLILSPATSQAIQFSKTPLSFTIEAWVYLSRPDLQKPQPIFARYPRTQPLQGNSRTEFLLQVQANGNLNLIFGGGSANPERLALNLDCGFNTIPPRQWTHVALSVATSPGLVNPSAAKIYLNGLLQCEWPGFDSANTTFSGTRQILHSEPFVFSKYELSPLCDEAIHTWGGDMDEVRVWAGVRAPEDILASYNTVDFSVLSNSTNLVGLFHLDRTQADLESGKIAIDSSPLAAHAQFDGVESAFPTWIPSGAPLTIRADATNFLLAPLTLYIFPADRSDTFGAQVDVESLGKYESLYLDPGFITQITSSSTVIPVRSGDYPMVYFYTTSPVSYTTTVRYRAVSYRNGLVAQYSNWAVITVFVTVTGCDGQGAEMDQCGVCGGDGRCEPFGCDGEGARLDECGVCDGKNNCRCSLANWRGYATDTLDKGIIYYDLEHLNSTLTATNDVLDDVTQLLLDKDPISCSTVGEALAKIKRLQAKTLIYNDKFLQPFLELLS